jgi:hypothetical protein
MLRRSGILTLLLFGSLALPSAANADSLTLSAPGAVQASSTGTVSSTVATSGSNMRLEIVLRPARHGACAANPQADYAKAGDSSQYQTILLEYDAIHSGTRSWPVDGGWPSTLGSYTLCGWLYDYSNDNAVTAVASRAVTVRAGSGKLTLTLKQTGSGMDQFKPKLSGRLKARAKGTASSSSSLGSTVISATKSCPASLVYDGHTAFDFPTLAITGAFNRVGNVDNALKVGKRYRACAYLRDDRAGGATIAKTSKTFVLKSKPRDPAGHFLTLTAGHPYATEKTNVPDTLTCHKGKQWRAYPTKIKFSYRWFRSGKRVKGRTRSKYHTTKADHDKRMTCDVVAKNAVGTTVEDAANPMYVVH